MEESRMEIILLIVGMVVIMLGCWFVLNGDDKNNETDDYGLRNGPDGMGE